MPTPITQTKLSKNFIHTNNSQNMFSPNYSSSSSASPSQFYSRKLLLYTPASPSSSSSSAAWNDNGPTPMNHHGQMDLNSGETRFDANVVMVLSVLFCALVCSLALNSVIKCVRWCSSRINSRSNQNTMTDQLSTAANNTGVKSMTLKTFPTLSYSTGLNLSGLNSECNICLSEFGTGEAIRVLPKCNHGFHINCIDKWLISHSSCPTCRQSLLENCVKIDVSSSELPPLRRSTISTLEPEGLMRNYRDIN